MRKIMRLLALGGLAALAPLALADKTIGLTTGHDFDLPGSSVQAAVTALTSGETLHFADAGTYDVGLTQVNIVGGRTITFDNTSGSTVTVTQTQANLQTFLATAAAGPLNLTINGTGGFVITQTAIVTSQPVFQTNQDTVNATAITLNNVKVIGLTGGGGFFMNGSNADASPGTTVNATGSTFSIGSTSNSARCAFGTFISTMQQQDNLTLNVTNCNFSAGTTNADLGAPVCFSSGTTTVLTATSGSANWNVTFTGCNITGYLNTTRPMVGFTSQSTGCRLNNSNFTFNDCTMKQAGYGTAGGVTFGFTNSSNDAVNLGGNTVILRRCVIDNTAVAANANGTCIRNTMTNSTAATLQTTNFRLYNCLIKSSSNGTLNNGCMAVRSEGKIDNVWYHNTFVSLAAGGATSQAGDKVGIMNTNVDAPTWTLSDNIIYNYNLALSFNNTVGSLGTVTNPTVNPSANLYVSTSDTNAALSLNRDTAGGATATHIFDSSGTTLGTNVLGTNFVPLGGSTAVDAATSQVAGVPDGVVSAAIGSVDITNVNRGNAGTWDIGAYETNAVPVELSTFSAE